MKRAVLAVAVVVGSSGVAFAGGYVGLGIGTGPAISTDGNASESDGRSGRLMVGYRFGRISVEGALTKFDVLHESQSSLYPAGVWIGALSGKYNLPLGDGFEAFGRIGVQKTWFGLENDERFDASGTGLVAGVGMEYRLPLAVTRASIWIDYQYSRADLDGELTRGELSARMWTLGATLGF